MAEGAPLRSKADQNRNVASSGLLHDNNFTGETPVSHIVQLLTTSLSQQAPIFNLKLSSLQEGTCLEENISGRGHDGHGDPSLVRDGSDCSHVLDRTAGDYIDDEVQLGISLYWT